MLYTIFDEGQAQLLRNCAGNLDFYVVVNDDRVNPQKMENDGAGQADRRKADFNANDVHRSLWFTPTQALTYTLDLYVVAAGQPFADALLTDRLSVGPVTQPELVVLTDLRELFKEFNQTLPNSATQDTNNNDILDYYEAVARMSRYAADHKGVVVDVRQNGYRQDYDYAASRQNRVAMGADIDKRISVPLAQTYRTKWLIVSFYPQIAIIGDDAVVPFYRVPNPAPRPFFEDDYPGQVDGSVGLNTSADGNPTLLDSGYVGPGVPKGYMMSDVPYGTITDTVVNYPIPVMQLGRIFYAAPLKLAEAIDAYEQPIDVRAANTSANAPYLANERNLHWKTIFERAIRPVLRAYYGYSWWGLNPGVQDDVALNQPAAYRNGYFYLYSGQSTAWDDPTATRAAGNTKLMLFYTHADHVSWQTEAARRGIAGAQDVTSASLNNAMIAIAASTGCHWGYSVAYQQNAAAHPYYNRSLVGAMLNRHVTYFAPTVYGYGDNGKTSHHDLLIHNFLSALFESYQRTVGSAYSAAFVRYTASGDTAGDVGLDKYVLYSMHLYGLLTQPLIHRNAAVNLRVEQASPAFAALASVVAGAPVTATETLTIPQFAVTFNAAGEARFDIPMQGGVGGESFGPLLPTVYRRYPLPVGATEVAVTLLQTQTRVYPAAATMQSSQPVGYSFGPLSGAFTMTNPYPATIFTQQLITDSDGLYLALTLTPLQYNPEIAQVTLYDRVDYRITYQAPNTVTVAAIQVNADALVEVGHATVPVSVTLNSAEAFTGTLRWAVENGAGVVWAQDSAVFQADSDASFLGWDLDTTQWTPGLVHLWVAIQDEDGMTIATGWLDFVAQGEQLTVETAQSTYSDQDAVLVIRAAVRDGFGVGVDGRADDLRLWLDGVATPAAWVAANDGHYTTTVSLATVLTGGHSFSVTLESPVLRLNQAPLLPGLGAGDSFLVDRTPPTSTVWLTATGDLTRAWAFVGWGDDASGPTVITVEYQIDGGAWQFWRIFRPGYVEGTDALFGPTEPVAVDVTRHGYCFRSQAADGAGHVEAAHAEADTCTARVYAVYLPVVLRAYDSSVVPANTRYVKRYGTDAGDCLTPATACGTIQYAIDVAQDGDVIAITGYADAYSYPGDPDGNSRWTYWQTDYRPKPDGYYGPDNVTQVALVDKSLTLRGGYAADFGARNPAIYKTVLRPGLDGGDGRGILIAPFTAVTLEDLIILEGNATGQGGAYHSNYGYYDTGGGVYALNVNYRQDALVIRNCVIAGNWASGWRYAEGGGIYLENRSGATLTGNAIYSNTTTRGEGAGVNVGVTTDIDGDTRDALPDIGADEYKPQ